MDTLELRYTELTRWRINKRVIDDLNVLLPQLSPTARICTRQWLKYMFKSGTRIFVAIDGKTIVATVLLCPMVILVGQKDWIEDVVVDEKYRRRGISSRLMDMAEEASRKRGAKSINLTSKPDRGGARQMYEDRDYDLRETGVFRKVFRKQPR
jgi:GNAT superfamily N-acetyltransferase